MKWSQRQLDIFDFVANNPSDSLIIEAVAGSGKTTTIVELSNRMPQAGIFLAFNKSIATTLQSKLPPHIAASTFHSLGYKILRARISKIKVDEKKVLNMIKASGMNEQLAYPAAQLVAKGKTYGVGYFTNIDDQDAWMALLDTSSEIDIPEGYTPEQVCKFAATFLAKSNETLNAIDFDDMIYLPLILYKKHGWKPDTYPFIIVDEAQDTSGVQIELLRLLTQRVIAVGDRYQAIYAFRGADYTAMDNIKHAFQAHELPLDITYRCPVLITEYAQQYVPHIQHREHADLGNIVRMSHEEGFYKICTDELADTIVVCRTNAPLIRICLNRLKHRKRFTCLSDFPKRLTGFVNSIRSGRSIQDFAKQLSAKHDQIIAQLQQKNLHARIAVELDKYEALCILMEDCLTVDDLKDVLQRLLYAQGGPLISTIHKAKGLEKANVYFFNEDLCPAPWVLDRNDKNEIQQEFNLRYVAVTRAEDTLYLVESEPRK